jgi:hypothetical protein
VREQIKLKEPNPAEPEPNRVEIPNAKLQIPNKFQISNDQSAFLLFQIWTIGFYLLFGACDLVLLLGNQTFVSIFAQNAVSKWPERVLKG